MLLNNIFLKTLRDKRVALSWWSIGFFLYNFLIASLYPSIQDAAGELEGYIEKLPDAFKAMFLSGAGDITSPAGYLNAESFTLMIPVMLLIFGIGFGAAAVAGEEEAGTLDLLLSNPLPRWRVVVEKFFAMVVGMSVISLASWLSLFFGALLFDMDIGAGQLAAATVSGALLGLSFGAIALAVGCATGRKGFAIAVGVAVAVGSYLLNIMAKIVESLEPYEKFSLFYYNLNTDPLVKGLKIGDVAVFVGFAVVLLTFSIVLFQRRDLSV